MSPVWYDDDKYWKQVEHLGEGPQTEPDLPAIVAEAERRGWQRAVQAAAANVAIQSMFGGPDGGDVSKGIHWLADRLLGDLRSMKYESSKPENN